MEFEHIVNPKTEKWYHLDKNNLVWTCDCRMEADKRVSLCISICEHLKAEGELREIKRQIAEKRKELGLLPEIK